MIELERQFYCGDIINISIDNKNTEYINNNIILKGSEHINLQKSNKLYIEV